MVVVVPDPILIASRRPGGLDTTDESLFGQDPEGVIHPLSRDGADLGAYVLGDGIRGAVRPPRHRPKHSQPLGCDLDAMFAKELGWICHGRSIKQILDIVKYLIKSIPVMAIGWFGFGVIRHWLAVNLSSRFDAYRTGTGKIVSVDGKQ
jgi:hypothetical protein